MRVRWRIHGHSNLNVTRHDANDWTLYVRHEFHGDGPAFFPFAKNMSILSEHE